MHPTSTLDWGAIQLGRGPLDQIILPPDAPCTCWNSWICFSPHTLFYACYSGHGLDRSICWTSQLHQVHTLCQLSRCEIRLAIFQIPEGWQQEQVRLHYMNILDPSGFLFLGQISTVNIQSMHAPSLFSPPQLWVICSQVSVHLCAQRPLLQWLRGNGSHEMQHDGACQFRD